MTAAINCKSCYNAPVKSSLYEYFRAQNQTCEGWTKHLAFCMGMTEPSELLRRKKGNGRKPVRRPSCMREYDCSAIVVFSFCFFLWLFFLGSPMNPSGQAVRIRSTQDTYPPRLEWCPDMPMRPIWAISPHCCCGRPPVVERADQIVREKERNEKREKGAQI